MRHFQGKVAITAALLALLAGLPSIHGRFAAAADDASSARGPIRLDVDATHAPQKILHAHLTMPVHPGSLTLYYPEWIPGEHMPDGPLTNLAGLQFSANGQKLPWRRDLVDMYSLHLQIPEGASSLDISLDFLLNAPLSGYTSGASATAYLDTISWNQVLLYPDNSPPAEILVQPSVTLPVGWQFATALTGGHISDQARDNKIEFAPVALDRLIDSPLLAGKFFRRIDLTPGEMPDREIDIAADSSGALAMPGDMEKHYKRLIGEAQAVLGPPHYENYKFLLALSDSVAHFGVEHRESSDDRDSERSLTDETQRLDFSDLLPHEYVHAWNGKYRRPVGLDTKNYQEPMKDDLLWVYEGLTQYLGEVLAVRSGLRSPEIGQEMFAQIAAQADARSGRGWRSLQDTADGEPAFGDTVQEWESWRRGTDYYEEGELLWFDIDTTLRRLTNDRQSVDTFCQKFFAGPVGYAPVQTYTFDDVVSTLNSLAPYNWAKFLRDRLDETPPPTADEAAANSGWRLVYTDQNNRLDENADWLTRWLTYVYSVGMTVSDDGYVSDVIVGGPIYKAGIGPEMRISAINGKTFSDETLREAIRESQNSAVPITLTAANGRQSQDYTVDYHGGIRFPHLERDKSKPDYLSEILSPHAK